MTTTKILIILSLLSLFVWMGCKTSQQPDGVNQALLLNCWKHAYEEETDVNLKIFRPCDYTTFAASRFRNTFTLHENGTSNYLTLSPYDAHYMSDGKWEYNPETKVLILKDENNVLVNSFEVIEILADRLTLR